MKLSAVERHASVISFVFLVSGVASAAVPGPKHKALTQAIENAALVAQQLEDEAGKGKGSDTAKMKSDVSRARNALQSFSSAYRDLLKESLDDPAEAHFQAIQKHYVNSSAALAHLEMELSKGQPNESVLKKNSKLLVRELESAASAHEAELREIEIPKN